MGDFSEHFLFGLLFGLAIYTLADINLYPGDAVLSVFLVFAGSVLPDIDHSNSYVYRSTRAFIALLSGFLVLAAAGLEPLYSVSLALAVVSGVYLGFSLLPMEHRGLMHRWRTAVSISSLAVIAGFLLAGSVVPGMALGTGFASHLVLDGEFRF